MLQSKLIMFSRSLMQDYRWIYSDSCITADDKNTLQNDYRHFELNRDSFLSKHHIVTHRLGNSVAVFKFSLTNQTDSCSRPIFALTGLVFSESDARIVLSLPIIVLAFLFRSDDIFNPDHWEISDEYEDRVLPVELSLDSMCDEYRSNPEFCQLTDRLMDIESIFMDIPVLITNENMTPINNKSYTSLTQHQPNEAHDAGASTPVMTASGTDGQEQETVTKKKNLIVGIANSFIKKVFSNSDSEHQINNL